MNEEGSFKFIDVLFISKFVQKEIILVIKPVLFSSAILLEMIKQSLAILSVG